jgi:glucosamine kinase
MPAVKLIADSGSTKTEWCIPGVRKNLSFFTDGISPYFLDTKRISALVSSQLLPQIGKYSITEIHYYGTGCLNPDNRKMVVKALKQNFPDADIEVDHDLMGAARAVCGHEKGIACILGTGSNSCYYNGKKIVKNSPGLGYVLGDEGSGAYLGKKVLQYYLYNTFDEDLRSRFDAKYVTNSSEILDNIYKKPLANRYMASFTLFLAENRGHYMIENIIEDGLNDFFFNHIYKYGESWKYPIHFIGGVAYGFRDVLQDLAGGYELTVGKIMKNPMEGLAIYHR